VKKIILPLFLIIIQTISFAEEDGDASTSYGSWFNVPCEVTHKPTALVYGNSAKYEGSMQIFDGDQLPDGEGTYRYPSEGFVKTTGAIYNGEFQKGMFHGKGLLKFRDGVSYKGEFKGNKYSGTGTCTDNNGVRTVGKWNDRGVDVSKWICPDGKEIDPKRAEPKPWVQMLGPNCNGELDHYYYLE
tara:strand:+ start:127 stop:684 length:558 start_codon:yes stop_codon:yes gene_type:complete